MSILQALTVDIVNTAKGTKDAKNRLFNLEQVREILLFRDTSLIETFISDVFDFTVDKSALIRRFLIKFANELFQINPNLAITHLIEMYRFFLDDSNDSIIQVMTQEIGKNYSKIILLLCTLGLNSSNQSQISHLWTSLKAIVGKLNEIITSKRSENLREQCIRLLEEEILFGFPNTTVTTDPRLARRTNDPRLARSGGAAAAASTTTSQVVGGTADEIPAHHPFISKTDIQKEAEEFFSKLVLWTNKGASQGATFTPHLISVMAQVVGSIGTMRPTCSANAAQLITFLISNKAAMIQQMTRADKENLLRATHRLVRATSVFAADPEGQMQKLKGLISQLESMTTSSNADDAEAGAIVGGKRDASAMLEDSSALIDEAGEEKPELKRARIVAALDEAQKNKELQLSKASDNSSGAVASGAMMVESVFLQSVSEGEFTELSSDLVSFHTLSINFHQKLVNVQASSAALGGEFICQPIPFTASSSGAGGYSDLSTFLFVKIIENYLQLMRKEEKTRTYYCNLLIRMTLQLMKSTMDNPQSFYQVPIINSWGYDAPKEHRDVIPVVTSLPRCLWLFLSFCFQHLDISSISSTTGHSLPAYQTMNDLSLPEGSDALALNFQTKIDLLGMLCLKLYNLASSEDFASQEEQQHYLQLYESTVFTSLSRIMQIQYLREYAGYFLLQLPKIPNTCISLLIILMLSSSKLQVKETKSHHQHQQQHQSNIRNDSLHLLGQIVTDSQDEEIAESTLHHLLWFSVDEEIELRYRIIGLFTSDVYKRQSWIDETINQFITHSLIAVVSKEVFLQYSETQSEENLPIDSTENEVTAVSFFHHLSEYQNGEQFHGNFEEFFALYSNDGTIISRDAVKVSRKDLFKRVLHPFQQLTLVESSFLHLFTELFIVLKSAVNPEGSEGLTKEEVNSIGDDLFSTLKTVIPVISHHTKDDSVVFSFLVGSSATSLVVLRPLIKHILTILTTDVTVPVQAKLVESVQTFYTSGLNQTAFSIDILTDDDIGAFGQLINGLSPDVIEQILPKLIRCFGDEKQLEELKVYFSKLTKCRPPAMTKANLLAYLHRLNFEAYDIKAKAVLDAITLCLNNKSEFHSDVIKEALQTLQNDEIPPYALMRTAILASQSYADMKKFVLQETIPILIKKTVWTTAPKVWEGVIFGIKNLITGNVKTAEPTLRALLQLPGKQLLSVLKVAVNSKQFLGQFFQSLSNEEKTSFFTETDNEKNKLLREFGNAS